ARAPRTVPSGEAGRRVGDRRSIRRGRAMPRHRVRSPPRRAVDAELRRAVGRFREAEAMKGGRLGAIVLLAAAVGGCAGGRGRRGYEYMPDMAVSVPYDTFARNPVTRNGMTQQLPVRGTIPRGFLPLHYSNTPEDAERAGRELTFPHPPGAED